MRKYLFLFVCILFMITGINAQVILTPSVISSGGGYGENGNISISWTLGELAVTTLKGESMLLTQGFQQPFDIGDGIRKDEVSWDISVYPNPVKDELRIRFNIENAGDFLLEIQDVAGRLIRQEQRKQISTGDIVILNTSTCADGIYFLKILTPDRQQVQVISLRKL